MADDKTPLELLKTTPITELSVGKATFRRSLERKGYRNLVDVLNLTDSEIDRVFSLDDACAIESLQESFKSNPEEFAKRVLDKPIHSHPEPSKPVRSTPQTLRTPSWKRERTPLNFEWSSTQVDPFAYLHLPFVGDLSKYEKRAKEVFNDLNDRQDNVIVYQCFDNFATEFDQINESFQLLFDHFVHKPKDALFFINKFLENIFLVYVADRARTFHEHQGFWKQYFPTIHINPSNSDAQTAFKQLFYSGLQDKNMPVYQEDESSRHFYLTALLHGGLSRSSWADLWSDSILPLARSNRTMGNGSQVDVDGREVLKAILGESSAYAPPKTELDLLRKAPVAIAAPLLESALRVGMQIESSSKIGSGPTMLTSYGLPDIAIEALIDMDNKRAGTIRKNVSADKTVYREILALPKANLQLDIKRGRVALHWNRQLFPLSKNTRRIDYYIDDVKKDERPLHFSTSKCTLDEMRIDVEPRPQYEVALKLMELDERSNTWTEIASLEQNFERINPGCFEFIQNAQEVFCLRRPSDRITRVRTIAYILDDGLSIDPGPGMELIEKYEPQGTWNARSIVIYKVAPGASGSITSIGEDGSQEEIAVWQENYRSNIDKTGVLGTTLSGIDLYGFIPDENGYNIGLPSFYIEAFDGRSALDDLDIFCQCDGERASIKREVLWEDLGGSGSKAARIKLSPAKSSQFSFHRHINLCSLEAHQRSTQGRPIFKYKFCVAPIQDFHLESIALNGYDLDAVYNFESSEDMFVIDQNQKIQRPDESGRFIFKTPLSRNTLRIRIVSSLTSKTTDALIDLAALDMSIPRHLIERARTRPLCLPDAQAGYNDGRCSIKAGNWSQSRAILVKLGDIPLYYKELSRPSTSDFSIFANVENFLQVNGLDARDLPLSLCVFYGYKQSGSNLVPAHADTTLLRCKEGFGFSTWDIRFGSQGDAFVKLDMPLSSDVEVSIRQVDVRGTRQKGKPFIYAAHEGEQRIPLPKSIITALQRRRIFEMKFTLPDEFAEFDSLFCDDEEGDDDISSNGLTTTFTLKGTDSHGK